MGAGDHDDSPRDEGRDHLDDHEGRFDDEASFGAPPDRLDRIWVHPTELPGAPAFTPSGAPRRPARGRALIAPIVAGAAGALVTVAVLAMAGVFDRTATPSATTTGADSATTATPTAAQVAQWIGGSVVAIAAHDATGTRRGSGVCVRHASEILTTARLVGNATTVDISYGDGSTHVAHVSGRDRTTDLVLLTLDGTIDIPAAHLADHGPTAGAQVWVVAGKDPGTTAPWMSSGMLSSNDATLALDGGPVTSGLLQTDAAASSSANGGALVDANGSVTGIVLGRLGNDGTTYAVPLTTALSVAEQLRTKGAAQHGDADFTAVDGSGGATVETVQANGAADRAGVKTGDVVSSVDGRSVSSEGDLEALLRATQPGQMVTVELRRAATLLKVKIEVGAETG